MSKLSNSAADEAHYAALSERMEKGDYSPLEDVLDSPATGMSLDELLSEIDELEPTTSDEPTPHEVSGIEDAAEQSVRELIALGRPNLNGDVGVGPSPKRQVRLPIGLDQALTERAKRERRNASEIIRDALDAYLRAS